MHKVSGSEWNEKCIDQTKRTVTTLMQEHRLTQVGMIHLILSPYIRVKRIWD